MEQSRNLKNQMCVMLAIWGSPGTHLGPSGSQISLPGGTQANLISDALLMRLRWGPQMAPKRDPLEARCRSRRGAAAGFVKTSGRASQFLGARC